MSRDRKKKNLGISTLISFEKNSVGWNACPCYSWSISFGKSNFSQVDIVLKIVSGWLHCLLHANVKENPLLWRWEWESGSCCTGLTDITAGTRQKLMWISLLIALVFKPFLFSDMGDNRQNESLVCKAVGLEPLWICYLHKSGDFSAQLPRENKGIYLCSLFAFFLWAWGQILVILSLLPYFKKVVSLIML